MIDFQPLWLTLELALITTVILLVVGIPLAWWLATSRFRGRAVIDAVVSLPLVLPPTVLGFYLLLAFSPEHAFGRALERWFDIRLAFTFPGIVLASLVYSLPFMVHPIRSGLRNLSPSIREAAYTLGLSPFATLIRVLLPCIRASVLTGVVLSFAHTIGEFGVVLMVGGNIPGVTKVVSLALYDEVQSLNYHEANVYAGILLGFSFLVLLGVYLIRPPFDKDDLTA
ncbi:molybdate ABC transporter permease subunit [Dinghuibacter silviterrae]|uniref:Molybdenum transport system permease n=1 Tax=Dinghuibacter silviterrae TaxID=1539049 RepID=A0A4R8DSR4_9BACT|nr:molybdate ABC transporter permease subunit [Dinghuibacter silviterrae]TDX01314.1 molybdate transport system permease protein [Dinghuibacter silviterrae]